MLYMWTCLICVLAYMAFELLLWHIFGGFILPQSKVSPSQEVTVTVTLHCTRKVLEGIPPQYFFKDIPLYRISGKTPSQVSLKLFPHSEIPPGITSHSISVGVFPHKISQNILPRTVSLWKYSLTVSLKVIILFRSIPLESIFYLAVSLWKYSLTVSLKVFYFEVSLWKYSLTVSLKVYFTSQYLSGSIPSQYLSGSIPSQYLWKYILPRSISLEVFPHSIPLQLCKYSFTLQNSFSQYCLKRLASHNMFPSIPSIYLTSKIFRYFSQNMKQHPSNLFHFSLKTNRCKCTCSEKYACLDINSPDEHYIPYGRDLETFSNTLACSFVMFTARLNLKINKLEIKLYIISTKFHLR